MSEEKPKTDLALVQKSDLALIENNLLNEKQLAFLLKRTPKAYIRKRPAKGGGEWEYVTGGYVRKVLNLMFGWNWSFEIVHQLIEGGEAIVKGRLTVTIGNTTISKSQFGNKEVMYKKRSKEEAEAGAERVPLSLGNDLKAAATDCLKKCAAEFGIAADIYNKEDFREVQIQAEIIHDWEYLKFLHSQRIADLTSEENANINRIIVTKEENSYDKVLIRLKA